MMRGHVGSDEESNVPKSYDLNLIKKLLGFALPYKMLLIGCLFLLAFTSIAQLSIPYITRWAIDAFIAPSGDSILTVDERWRGLLTVFCTLIFIHLSLAIGAILQMYGINCLGEKAMFDMREKLFGHLIMMKPAFFDSNSVGRIVTRVANDVNIVREFFVTVLVNIVADVLKLAGIVGLMIYIDAGLAFVTFSFLIPFIAISFFLGGGLRRAWRNIRKYLAQVNSYIEEHISGIAVVRIFCREKIVLREFDEKNKDYFEAAKDQVKIFSLYIPCIQFITVAGSAVIYWYGGWRIMGDSLTYGTLVAFVSYMYMFFHPLREMSMKYNVIQSAMAASERVFELMESDEFIVQTVSKGLKRIKFSTADTADAKSTADIADAKSPSETDNADVMNFEPVPEMLKGDICFNNVWFAYKNEDWILKGVSFELERGHSLAIVGPTGAGKTSIISLLLRHYEFQKGTITVDGYDIRTIPVNLLRKSFGCVRQDVFTFAGTIEDNIRLLDKDVTREQIEQAAKHTNALRFINELPEGFATETGERGQMLSMGQRQLLSFARVFVHEPQILLLDEATSNVDTITEHEIQEALSGLVREFTSIIVAHRLSTVKYVDSIIVLHRGHIKESGTHSQLLENKALYYKLYQLASGNGHIVADIEVAGTK
jgi:ATP-binding cassette subfamily B protein